MMSKGRIDVIPTKYMFSKGRIYPRGDAMLVSCSNQMTTQLPLYGLLCCKGPSKKMLSKEDRKFWSVAAPTKYQIPNTRGQANFFLLKEGWKMLVSSR